MNVRSLFVCLVSATFVAGFATIASAAPPAPPVPEIDPSMAASAIAVFAGSSLMLAERLGLRRK